jgi:hypothetical protein
MPPKSELFRMITERNALRRHAGLPLLDVREEIQKEAHRFGLIAYQAAQRKHMGDYLRIRAQVLHELRLKHGVEFGNSVGGQWAVAHRARLRFEEFLLARGIEKPHINEIVCGSDRQQ